MDGPVGKPKEVRVDRENLPKQGQNQPDRVPKPRASCPFTGGPSAANRSFAGLILNNTPPALGNNSSLRLDLVPRKTHFCGRQSEGDLPVTGTRTRQPQSVSATRLPYETSSKNAHLRVPFRRYIQFSRKKGNGLQPCSSTTANVVVHVRSLLNPRQEKKPQNPYTWDPRRNCPAAPGIIGHPREREDPGSRTRPEDTDRCPPPNANSRRAWFRPG